MKTDISGLMKFLTHDDWPERFQTVLEEHFGPAMDTFDRTYEEIGSHVGEQWAATLWGCVFEDFLTREFDGEHGNFVDVYLKRRGWKEKTQDKIYMRALRGSVMSLYEISDIVPGASMRARDLIRGGDPVLVSERSATRSARPWDRLALRIVPMDKGHVMSGGLLVLSQKAADAVMDAVGNVTGKRRAGMSDARLRPAAPLFTNAWLFDTLPRAMGTNPPVLHNSAGEQVMFHTVRFALRADVTPAEIGTRLDEIVSLRRETDSFWNWLGDASAAPRTGAVGGAQGLMWNVTMEDGSTVLGNVEMNDRFLSLMVNSASRADAGRALLHEALVGLVGEPLTEIQTVEQMMASRPAREARKAREDIPPEISEPFIHEMLDKQYRAILDEPVPVLGDISPRAAIRTVKGRQKVAAWLKYLENQTAKHSDPGDPMGSYDFGWMWVELGIEQLRR